MLSTRFAVGVHLLTALAFNEGKVLPSGDLAASVNTNPSFIRQVLGHLREAGLVRSQLGKGGGSTLARPPQQIRLDDVYRATSSQPTVALHHSEPSQSCPVGRGMKPLLAEVVDRAEQALLDELHGVTIADLVARIED